MWECFKSNLGLKILVGILVGILISTSNYLEGCKDEMLSISFFSSVLCTVLIWSGSQYIASRVEVTYSWLDEPVKKTIILLLINCIWVMTVLSSLFYLLIFIAKRPITPAEFYMDMVISLMVTLIINLFYITIDLRKFWQNTMYEVQVLKKENFRSQLESLKNQVNPHFLFNSLNTLISIIDEDKETAKNFIQELSQVYRYVLQTKDKDMCTLEEEIHFLKSYMFLLQIRYGENLHFKSDIPAYLLSSASIPPLTLQMLAENAIKHNVISGSRPLTFEIYVENESLIVKNNLQVKVVQVESNKIGLSNIIERYKMVTEEKVEILQTTSHFTVILPLLK